MKTSRTLVLSVGLLAVGVLSAQAQSAGAFSRLGFGARGIAMSNALVADAFGDASPYYNPALAPFVAQQNLEVSAALLSLDRELQFLQFATPLRPRAGITAGLIHAGVSDIDGRDGSGYHTQTFSTDEFAFFLAFGVRLSERVSGGIGLQFFRADFFDDITPANSIGIDAGINVRVTEALYLGLAIDDLLARYSWDTSDAFGEAGRSTSDRFPTRIRFGGAYRLMGGRARIVAEYESRLRTPDARTTDIRLVGDTPRPVTNEESLLLHDSRFRLGGEFWLADPFAVRAGVNRLADSDVSAAAPSAGFMVEQTLGELVAQAEYAFVLEPFAVGTMHFLTLRVFL